MDDFLKKMVGKAHSMLESSLEGNLISKKKQKKKNNKNNKKKNNQWLPTAFKNNFFK